MADTTARSRALREVAGRSVYFDDEGFFWDPDDWFPDAAEALAREQGMDGGLTEAQWKVLAFMRAWYKRQGRAPMNKELKAGTEMSLMELERLFPEGIKMGARKLAGLPNPQTCLD